MGVGSRHQHLRTRRTLSGIGEATAVIFPRRPLLRLRLRRHPRSRPHPLRWRPCCPKWRPRCRFNGFGKAPPTCSSEAFRFSDPSAPATATTVTAAAKAAKESTTPAAVAVGVLPGPSAPTQQWHGQAKEKSVGQAQPPWACRLLGPACGLPERPRCANVRGRASGLRPRSATATGAPPRQSHRQSHRPWRRTHNPRTVPTPPQPARL